MNVPILRLVIMKFKMLVHLDSVQLSEYRFLPCNAMLAQYMLSSCVCPSVHIVIESGDRDFKFGMQVDRSKS